jgi:hypothetical protein
MGFLHLGTTAVGIRRGSGPASLLAGTLLLVVTACGGSTVQTAAGPPFVLGATIFLTGPSASAGE